METVKLGNKIYEGVEIVRLRKAEGGVVDFSLGGGNPPVITAYVIGEPAEVTVPASLWDGTSCEVRVNGYESGGKGVVIGLPVNDSTTNSQQVIKSALTISNCDYGSANVENNTAAYANIRLSAVEAPSSDIKVAFFGLKEATTKVVITKPAIINLPVPVKGEKAKKEIECEQFTGTVTWDPNNATFAASTAYTATISITPKPGYTLSGVTANFFTLEGATSVSNNANSGIVTAKFPTTGA